jgi:hypothetical protein
MTENRSGKAERDPAPANLEPEENSRFPKIQVCDSRIQKLARTIDYVFGPA